MTLQPVAALPIDADLWWIVYLRGALVGRPESYASGVKFDRKIPNPRPARFVSVRRDGGSLTGVFDNPRVSLSVFADSEQNAGDLASLLVALAKRAPGVNGCVSVRHLSGPLDVADPSGQARRQVLIEAKHRANILAT